MLNLPEWKRVVRLRKDLVVRLSCLSIIFLMLGKSIILFSVNGVTKTVYTPFPNSYNYIYLYKPLNNCFTLLESVIPSSLNTTRTFCPPLVLILTVF